MAHRYMRIVLLGGILLLICKIYAHRYRYIEKPGMNLLFTIICLNKIEPRGGIVGREGTGLHPSLQRLSDSTPASGGGWRGDSISNV